MEACVKNKETFRTSHFNTTMDTCHSRPWYNKNDTIEMVECEQCNHRYRFLCADVDLSFGKNVWRCQSCAEHLTSRANVSVHSTTSSKRHFRLQLERLAKSRAIQNKLFEEKAKLAREQAVANANYLQKVNDIQRAAEQQCIFDRLAQTPGISSVTPNHIQYPNPATSETPFRPGGEELTHQSNSTLSRQPVVTTFHQFELMSKQNRSQQNVSMAPNIPSSELITTTKVAPATSTLQIPLSSHMNEQQESGPISTHQFGSHLNPQQQISSYRPQPFCSSSHHRRYVLVSSRSLPTSRLNDCSNRTMSGINSTSSQTISINDRSTYSVPISTHHELESSVTLQLPSRPGIMEPSKMLYGHPEANINTQIKSIKDKPPPKVEKFIEFAIVIRTIPPATGLNPNTSPNCNRRTSTYLKGSQSGLENDPYYSLGNSIHEGNATAEAPPSWQTWTKLSSPTRENLAGGSVTASNES